MNEKKQYFRFEITDTLGNRFLQIGDQVDCQIRLFHDPSGHGKNSDYYLNLSDHVTLVVALKKNELQLKESSRVVLRETYDGDVVCNFDIEENNITLSFKSEIDLKDLHGFVIEVSDILVPANGGSRVVHTLCHLLWDNEARSEFQMVCALKLLENAPNHDLFHGSPFDAHASFGHAILSKESTSYGTCKNLEFVTSLYLNPAFEDFLRLKDLRFIMDRNSKLSIQGEHIKEAKIRYFRETGDRDHLRHIYGLKSYDEILKQVDGEYPLLHFYDQNNADNYKKRGLLLNIHIMMNPDYEYLPDEGRYLDVIFKYSNIPNTLPGSLRLYFPSWAIPNKNKS